MRVRAIDPSESDVASARLFFSALDQFYSLRKTAALETCARTGALTLRHYHTQVKSVSAWELNPEHEAALIKLGVPEPKIGCAYQLAEECTEKYGMIVVDTPQGMHSDFRGEVHAEHFDLLPKLVRLLESESLLVLYVNKSPYDRAVEGSQGYDEYQEYDYQAWMAARRTFYGAAKIDESRALWVYDDLLYSHGFKVKTSLMIPCYSDVPGRDPYSFRLALGLERG